MSQQAKEIFIDGASIDGGPGAMASDWRALLRKHANQRWTDAVQSLSEGRPIAGRDDGIMVPLVSSLGTQAEEALGIVDRFSIGAAAEAFSIGSESKAPSEEFGSQLETILDGFAQIDPKALKERMAKAERQASRGRPSLFQSELWQLLHKIRESAELSYARELDLVELDRRILFFLRVHGPLVPAGLSAAIGVDKAQVSRSVKRLLEFRMVHREQIRSPVLLTRKGETLTDRLLKLAELRNRELSFDVSNNELRGFFGVMETLLDRAIMLYEQEREIANSGKPSDGEAEPGPNFEERGSGEPIIIDRSRIVSPLLTLSAYFSRSAALVFKRLTGLSNFEAWVLSEISYDSPTDWPRLVNALERDHSQAGRTVNHLIERGLVTREGKPGRRHGRFSPTEEGQRLFDIISKRSVKRSDYLMEPVAKDDLTEFHATFDKIRRNAAAQLERERALEEYDAS